MIVNSFISRPARELTSWSGEGCQSIAYYLDSLCGCWVNYLWGHLKIHEDHASQWYVCIYSCFHIYEYHLSLYQITSVNRKEYAEKNIHSMLYNKTSISTLLHQWYGNYSYIRNFIYNQDENKAIALTY